MSSSLTSLCFDYEIWKCKYMEEKKGNVVIRTQIMRIYTITLANMSVRLMDERENVEWVLYRVLCCSYIAIETSNKSSTIDIQIGISHLYVFIWKCHTTTSDCAQNPFPHTPSHSLVSISRAKPTHSSIDNKILIAKLTSFTRQNVCVEYICIG